MSLQKGGIENSLYQTRHQNLTFSIFSQEICSSTHSRFVSGDLCVFVLLSFYLQKRHISWENIFFTAAFWLVCRPAPLLSDSGNKAFLPESSVRWRGNGLHSNELFLQASFGSLFLYPLARGTNSKQQLNPWASKIWRNSADWTVRGSPRKSVL